MAVKDLKARITLEKDGRRPRRVSTLVVGAGQAGLAAGYFLKRQGVDFIILDAGARVGDAWRKRWDSLRLFTPARYDSLPGMPLPIPERSSPTKDEMADYLESYAKHFDLPIELNTRVERVTRHGEGFLVQTEMRSYLADNVISAMSSYQIPVIPTFAADLDPELLQMHSIRYRNPDQLRDGPVLVVGAGNSGAEIALDVARTHETWLSGRHPGHIPFHIDSTLGKYLLGPLTLRVLFHRVLRLDTPPGRKFQPKKLMGGMALIRTKPADLEAAGIKRVPRVEGIKNGQPVLEDGRVLDVANIIWCTGFRPNFDWIDLPVFDIAGDHKMPRHIRGVAVDVPGFYFLGLEFLYAVSSEQVHGMVRDAEYIVDHIAGRTPQPDVHRSVARAMAGQEA